MKNLSTAITAFRLTAAVICVYENKVNSSSNICPEYPVSSSR
jgi:hypothetical protein